MSTTSVTETPIEVKTTNIDIPARGRVFSYELAQLTPRCLVLTAQHTGAVRQFCSPTALNNFIAALTQHLQVAA